LKPKVLFILDKWCASHKQYGLSEWETNLWKSLKSTGLAEVTTFHYDAYTHLLGTQVDSVLIKKVQENRPDFICLVIYKTPGADKTVPTFDTLDTLKNKMKIPIIAVWGDLQAKSIVNTIVPYTTLNVYTATRYGIDQVEDSDNFFYSWVPKDQRLFHDYGVRRTIPLLYAGSTRAYRSDAIKFIQDSDLHIMITGGEMQKHPKTRQYASLLNQTQINLSFSRAGIPEKHVVNARVFETMLCGAMLLEQESEELKFFYKPFVDYVPYTSFGDMVDKIRFYLEHTEERLKIAQAGRDKTNKLYSADRFWRRLFVTLKEYTHE